MTNRLNDLLPVGLLAQLVRALHQYRRGQGFESRTSLICFFGFLFATAKVVSVPPMIFEKLLLLLLLLLLFCPCQNFAQ